MRDNVVSFTEGAKTVEKRLPDARLTHVKGSGVFPYPVPRSEEKGPDMVKLRAECLGLAVDFATHLGVIGREIYTIADDFVKYALTGEQPPLLPEEKR